MKKERKQTRKTVIKLHNRYKKEINRDLSSQSEWNIERCIKLQII